MARPRRRAFERFDQGRMVAERLTAHDALVFDCDQSSERFCYTRRCCAAARRTGSG